MPYLVDWLEKKQLSRLVFHYGYHPSLRNLFSHHVLNPKVSKRSKGIDNQILKIAPPCSMVF